MHTRLPLLLVAAALTGCAAVPTNTAAVAPKTDAQPSEHDKAWMQAVHQGNLTEAQAGRLAQGKGTTKQIKAIGRTLVQDHAKLDVEVAEAASRLGVRLPASTSPHQRAELTRLRDAIGKDFDEDFVAAMTKEHTAVIAATKTEISEGSSQAVVSLAKAAMPALQKHLTALRKAHGG